MAHRIPALRLHRPTGQAVVTLSGRDFYLGPHGTKRARDRYDQVVDQWLKNGRTLPETLRVNELIVSYVRDHVETYYRKDGEPTSRQHVIRLALRPVRQIFGKENAADFGPAKLRECRDWMIEAGWAITTINDAVHEVRKMFRWGVEHELVPADVWHALLAVRGIRRGRSKAAEPEPVRPVPEAYVAAVEPFVSRQVWAMIRLQLLTAMRPGEVVLMRAVDLDTSGDVWTFTPSRHKTEHHGKGREVFLGPKAQAVVRPFLVTDLERFLFSPQDAEEERRAEQRRQRRTPVQPSQRNRRRPEPKRRAGERYTTASYRRAIARGVERANEERNEGTPEVPVWTPNRLRHNAGTLARREGGAETSQVVLGHSNLKSTEVYAERDRARAVAFVLRHG